MKNEYCIIGDTIQLTLSNKKGENMYVWLI